MRVSIRGMSCNHCVMSVTKALMKVPGVDRVKEVSLDRGEAVVEGTPSKEAVVAAVQDAGYEAQVVG